MKAGEKIVCIRRKPWEAINEDKESEGPDFEEIVTYVGEGSWGDIDYIEISEYKDVYVKCNFMPIHEYIKGTYTKSVIREIREFAKTYKGDKL